MLRFLGLTTGLAIALTPLLPKVALSLPQLVRERVAAVPSSEKSFPVCYMQTSDGGILDLAALCTKPDSSSSPKAVESNPQIAINNLKQNGNLLTGQLTNQTGQAVKSVTVNYDVFDNQGHLIDSRAVKSQGSPIPPGGSVSFQDKINSSGAEIRATFVDWKY